MRLGRDEESEVAQKLFMYFRKLTTLKSKQAHTVSVQFFYIFIIFLFDFYSHSIFCFCFKFEKPKNFGFVLEYKAREIIYDLFTDLEKPSDVERFLGSYRSAPAVT